MRRKSEVFLLDLWKAADYIVRRTEGINQTEFLDNEDIRFAVERNFIILGEAVSQLQKYYPVVAANLDDLPAMIAFRNFIVHHYWSIDDDELWEIVVREVPPLRAKVAALLKEAESNR